MSQKEMNNMSSSKVERVLWERFEEKWGDR